MPRIGKRARTKSRMKFNRGWYRVYTGDDEKFIQPYKCIPCHGIIYSQMVKMIKI